MQAFGRARFSAQTDAQQVLREADIALYGAKAKAGAVGWPSKEIWQAALPCAEASRRIYVRP